jgi:hypothetical protein
MREAVGPRWTPRTSLIGNHASPEVSQPADFCGFKSRPRKTGSLKHTPTLLDVCFSRPESARSRVTRTSEAPDRAPHATELSARHRPSLSTSRANWRADWRARAPRGGICSDFI